MRLTNYLSVGLDPNIAIGILKSIVATPGLLSDRLVGPPMLRRDEDGPAIGLGRDGQAMDLELFRFLGRQGTSQFGSRYAILIGFGLGRARRAGAEDAAGQDLHELVELRPFVLVGHPAQHFEAVAQGA